MYTFLGSFTQKQFGFFFSHSYNKKKDILSAKRCWLFGEFPEGK